MAIALSAESKKHLRDNSESLSPVELALVRAAMESGLTTFTVPTLGDDHRRTDWKVKTWLVMRDGQPTAFLVAYQVLYPDFEVLGPEVALAAAGPMVERR